MKSECERNQLRRFSDLFSIIGGGTPKTSVPEYWNGDIPWLSVKDFCGDRKFVYSAEKSITQLGLDNSSTKLLQAGDIIVSARGTVGELAMVGKTMAFNQSCFGLRAKEGIDEHYLYYLTQTKINELKKLSHGSVFDTITRETFEKVTCHVPPLPVQRKIASILSALDDKIETNNAICCNLEDQASSIFSKYYLKGNTVANFASAIRISCGGTPKTGVDSYWNGPIPFFTPKDAESPFVFSTEKTITTDGLNNCSSPLYAEWTTFITARGTVGKISMAGVAMAMNQSCYALVSETVHPLLVYFYTREVVKSLTKKASGSVFDTIVTRDFDREEIKLIDQEEELILLEQIEPLYVVIRNLKKENHKLSHIRDVLISKLMSKNATDVSA